MLRRIIKEEVARKLDEYEKLQLIDPESLERAGLTYQGRLPKRPKQPFSPFLDIRDVSPEAIEIANQLGGFHEDVPTTSIVQRVLDILKSKGIGITEE